MNDLVVMALAAAAALATMLGGLFALALQRRVAVVLGFSAGAVLGVALFDLAPESFALAANSFGVPGLMAAGAAGFLLYGLLVRLTARRGDPARGTLGAGSFSLHSVLDGLGIGFAFQAGHGVGLVVASAVLAHDFSDGLNTVNVVVKNGGTRRSALRWLIADALAPVAGAGLSLFWHLPAPVLGPLLAAFAGVFFYIGAVELLPESQRKGARAWAGLATVLGAAFLFGVTRIVS
jgi:ZIP family zinc transporter